MIAPRSAQNQPGYESFIERSVDDATYLWSQRTRAVQRADYDGSALSAIDKRLRANLNVLALASDKAWPLICDAYTSGDAGGLFAASVLAFHSADARRIEEVIAASHEMPELWPGFISAFGWLPGPVVHPWVKKLLLSDDNRCHWVAVAACSVRRDDPREFLTQLVERPRTLTTSPLCARICRLIGEVKRHDLSRFLQEMQQHEEERVRFWAHWSSLLLGDSAAITGMQGFALQPSHWQDSAMDLVFRCLSLAQGRHWISQLAKGDRQRRQVIRATGILGDLEAVPWLIAQMREPSFSRVAGEAFSALTGIDLRNAGLSRELPDLPDEEEATDDDDSLPWPDAERVYDHWHKGNQPARKRTRFLFGKEITDEHLQQIFALGNQRQRGSAALELALRNREQIFLNCAAPVDYE